MFPVLLPANMPGKAEDGTSVCAPAPMRKTWGRVMAPGFKLAVVAFWGVNSTREDFSLFLSLDLLFK